MKISSNVLQFAQGNTKLFEQFADYWNHYNNRLNGKKVEFDATHSLDEKEALMNAALKKEIIRRSGVSYATEANIGEWFYHPVVIHETFAIISALIDMILPDSIIDTIGLYSDVRTGGFGDSFAFDVEPRDLFVVSKSGKAQRQAEVKKQFKGQVTLLPEWHMVTVGASLYQVLSGKESLAAFAAKAVRSIETQMTYDTYDAFATAMSLLSSTATTGLQVSGYTQASLVRLCQQVQAWSLGAKPVILGTQLALVNVLPDDANYRYTLSDEYVSLGYIRTAFGYDVMALPQVANLTTFGALKIANDRLFIVAPASQKIIKLCIEGNTLSNTTNTFDNANLTQTSTLWKSWTAGVATNAIAGLLTL